MKNRLAVKTTEFEGHVPKDLMLLLNRPSVICDQELGGNVGPIVNSSSHVRNRTRSKRQRESKCYCVI